MTAPFDIGSNDSPSWLRDLLIASAKVIAIALAYFVTGKLGLMLAIPPGYATAIWPASGIALAALLLFGGRFWPGVFLGSFLTNILVVFAAPDTATIVRQILTAFTIGGGAALQASLGAALIRRTIGFPVQLITAREIATFLILGGPIACLVNASWGVGFLSLTGAIPVSGIAYSWWTWWIGDTIGVLIFTPLAIMWLDRAEVWKSRRWIVTLSLSTTFLAAVMVFLYASRSEWGALKQEFDKDATEIGAALQRRLALHATDLGSIANLFAASEQVSRAEFLRFTREMVFEGGDGLGVAWVPIVRDSDRAAMEVQLPATARSRYFFSMYDPWPASPKRDIYTPVLYFKQRSNVDISGFDLNTDQVRRETLALARDGGELVASPMVPMTLAPGKPQDGFLLIKPIYEHDDVDTVEARRAHIKGYAIGFFRVAEFVGHKDVLSIAGTRMRFVLTDITDARKPKNLFQYQHSENSSDSLDMRSTLDLSVGGRTWRLTATPTLEFITGNTTLTVWLVLAGGLLFSALVGVGALILTGRTSEIEAQVLARTDELALINHKLSVEVADHVRTERSLKEQHTFLELVLDNSNEGIVAFDAKGQITLINSGARRTLKRIAGDIAEPKSWRIDTRYFRADGVTPLPDDELPIMQALRGATIVDYEMVAASPNRRPVIMLVTAWPLPNAQDERNGALVFTRDITESRASERLKREFISVVSHELRTPLTSIRGSLGLINSGATGVLPPKAQHLTGIAYRNCERLSLLINDILDIDKIESGHMSLDVQTQSLGDLLQQAVEANVGYARSCNVELVLDRELLNRGIDVMVHVDAHRLLQVMANLLSNAAKFSPSGATVSIGLQVRGETARVSVRDHGAGIPVEFQPRIFQKFSQADGSDSRLKRGTGLGLAISKALIERMGGRIDYVTEAGHGTTFFFELRIANEDSLAHSLLLGGVA